MAKVKSSTAGIRKGTAYRIFEICGIVLMVFLSVVCLLPFVMLLSGSFTKESYILQHGYGLWPGVFSIEAYTMLLRHPIIVLRAYGVTIFVTIAGTMLGLFVTSMASYVVSRQDFIYRNRITFYFYFTTLFNGGLLATYIFIVRYLHLKGNIIALIIPYTVNVFYMLILRSFMKSVPISIVESAKMDGAGEFTAFIRLVLPLSKSGLATIGLFLALDYWNDWYNAMLYMVDAKKYPLQYLLYNLLQQREMMERMANQAGVATANLPGNSLKLAMAVLATGPIVLVYPFVQRYFVQGITIGAVKG